LSCRLTSYYVLAVCKRFRERERKIIKKYVFILLEHYLPYLALILLTETAKHTRHFFQLVFSSHFSAIYCTFAIIFFFTFSHPVSSSAWKQKGEKKIKTNNDFVYFADGKGRSSKQKSEKCKNILVDCNFIWLFAYSMSVNERDYNFSLWYVIPFTGHVIRWE
jgi:hypothetical protein